MSGDIKRNKFSDFSNITVGEAAVWAKVCQEDSKSPEQILELLSCVDDLLTIQNSTALINKRRGNTRNRRNMKDVMIGRIMQMRE